MKYLPICFNFITNFHLKISLNIQFLFFTNKDYSAVNKRNKRQFFLSFSDIFICKLVFISRCVSPLGFLLIMGNGGFKLQGVSA